MSKEYNTVITNVLVIGAGGAGLRAAIEISESGLSVLVIGKRDKSDSHTSLAAGGINAALGNIDPQDSWQQHFADTYLEGYSIGQPEIIEIMSKESPDLVREIDNWGANFDRANNGSIDQRYFGAHTYRRTCYTADCTGKTILNTLLKKASDLNIPIKDTKYVTELLVENNSIFGAFSFDINSGERTLYLADAVILATGGHTRIWKKSSSRKDENTGDGIFLALKAGCEVVDMEMVQFHPTGMLFPNEIAGTLVTEAVRGEGGKLFNNLGERFMSKYDPERLELSTRDRVAFANYSEIINGRGTKNGGVFLDITHIKKEEIIKKLPSIYKQFIEYQMLDISKEMMEVAPTAHYSMGGVLVSPAEHSTNINGLFACGEVAGGLHGANRLGGNSLAEILVFGKKVGQAAAHFSKNIKSHNRSINAINLANKNIDKLIKEGEEIGRKLEFEIQDLMWNYCGVVRDREKLTHGLSKLKSINERFSKIDVRVSKNNYSDLVVAHNIRCAIYSAEASLKSALIREESIGSHQRSDFPSENTKKKVNYICFLSEDSTMSIREQICLPLGKELDNIVNSTKKIKSFVGKLIE